MFYLLVYIFAVWEYTAENHLLMLLLKMSRDFDCEVPMEDHSIEKLHCNWSYASASKFLLSVKTIFVLNFFLVEASIFLQLETSEYKMAIISPPKLTW